MYQGIHVIDDFLLPFQQDNIENLILRGDNNPWKFFNDIALPDKEVDDLGITKVTPGIGLAIINDTPKYIHPDLLNGTQFLVHKACAKVGLQCKQLVQGRSFITFPLDREIRKEYDNIHVDLQFPHMVCLYYVNDTDGDTFIFDKCRGRDINSIDDFMNSDYKVLQRVTPKKGRAVIFDGSRYHSSSSSTKNIRCIVNFDFLT
jgi:hypothetical protein